MNNDQVHVSKYLEFCQEQKRLDAKTLKAYEIDLRQFSEYLAEFRITSLSIEMLEDYLSKLHQKYKPRTVKRKIASIKAFFHYLEYKKIIDYNPVDKIYLKFREPVLLPKVIPLHTVEILLSTVYKRYYSARTDYQKKNILRDVAVLELLFATGMRISELCSLRPDNVDLENGTVLIYGKGAKERRIQIGNSGVLCILREYQNVFTEEIIECESFFINHVGNALLDQSVRRMINKYTELASVELHITPHMFRHTFATSLLEADVDIRYIQEMLGHSSISVTQIYTHVSLSKQRDILTTKHPRNSFNLL